MRLRKEFNGLVSEHLDGTPSVHSTRRLDEILKRNPRLRKEFSEQVMMHRFIAECFQPSATGADAPPLVPVAQPKRTWFERVKDRVWGWIRPFDCPACRRAARRRTR
jgi:hypothetical protein